MTYFQLDRVTLLAVGLLFSVNSQAVLLTADDNYASDSYFSAGTYTGSFDINALMDSTFGSDAYVVNSGYIGFSFFDDANDVSYVRTINTSSWGSHTSGYSNSYDRIYTNPDESVIASTGEQSLTATGTYYSSRTYSSTSTSRHRVSRGYYRDVSCGWWDLFRSCEEWVDTSYYVNDYKYYYNNESGYAIDTSFNLNLDDVALDDLMVDGVLGYNLDIAGDLLLTNATMIFDVTLRETSSVPEPVSLALMGLGLAGMGFARRKKAA